MSASYFLEQAMIPLEKDHTENLDTQDPFPDVKNTGDDKEEAAYLIEEEEDEEPVDNTQD
jgi:hypothetical protein